MGDNKEKIFQVVKWLLSCTYTTLVIMAYCFKWIYNSLNYWKVKPRPVPPPSLTKLPFDASHKYFTVNGVKLHCVCAGDENKPLMLFVHGFPEFWYSWRHQMKYFCERYWVVAMDMRGYGDSDKPSDIGDYTMAKLIGDVKGLVQALGRKKVDVLVCHDWGGAVCWTAVTQDSSLAEKFIAINIPHPAVFARTLQSSWKQFFMSWYIFFFQMPFVPEMILRCNDMQAMDAMLRGEAGEWADRVSGDEIEAFKYTYAKPGAFTGPINYYRANASMKRHEGVAGKKVESPTLVIWGDQDIALSVQMAHMSKNEVNDFTLEIVEGAPHFIMNTHPDDVNKLMDKWLTNH